MATSTKKPQVPGSKGRGTQPRPWIWALLAAALAAVVAVAVAVVLTRSDGESSTRTRPAEAESAAALPDTPDYHSLAVSPTEPRTVLLGTHNGLFRSQDGGRTWSAVALGGQDAMNLVRSGGKTLWVAGHDVLAKSGDGGETWSHVRPAGLPGLDVHGFAADPRNPRKLYAAIAGTGLYRSADGGVSFSRVSTDVGPDVMALAVMPNGRIFAGDMQKGLMASRDGGQTWAPLLRARLLGLAVSPADPKRILAAGPGILLSVNGGLRWRRVLDVPEGVGPIAWSPTNPRIAYAVGFDRTLYRTSDGGRTWTSVQ